MPEFQGKYPIPSIEFIYFDPKLEAYKTLFSQELIVDVYDGPTSGLPSVNNSCLLYTSPSPRDRTRSRMPSSA